MDKTEANEKNNNLEDINEATNKENSDGVLNEELKQKIIKEQDLVSLYIVRDQNKCTLFDEKYYKNVKFRDLKKIVTNDFELLKNFSTDNLIKVLSSVYKNDYPDMEKLTTLIFKRLEKEDFFCEDIDINGFFLSMGMLHSSNLIFGKLSKDQIDKVKLGLDNRTKNVKGSIAEGICNKITNYLDLANFIRYFEKGIFTPEKVEFLEKILEKNENALRYFNFGLLQDDIFKMGPEFIEFVSKFSYMSTQLVTLQKINPELLEIISKRVQGYENLKDNLEEIELLITFCTRNGFNIDPKNVDKINVDELLNCALLESKRTKDSRAVNVDYGPDFEQRLLEELDKKYKEAYFFEDKLTIYLSKRFSMTQREAKEFVEGYGSDLSNLNGITQNDKEVFEKIKSALDIKSKDELDKLYESLEERYSALDIFNIKKNVSKECAKTFFTTMNKTDEYVQKAIEEKNSDVAEEIIVNGKKVEQIKIKGKFDLILHSTDSGFISNIEKDKNEDYVKMWFAGKHNENHIISGAYINNDFMGCPPVGNNGVMYGFTKLDEKNIKLMGATDINTYSTNFAYDAVTQKYMSAKTLPYSSRRVYSEIGIERDGVKPDYVIIFDDMNENVKQNAYQAAAQFGIQVLFIDKSEIEKEQLNNLQSLNDEFNKTGDSSILKRLINTYETNVAGWLLNRAGNDETYSSDIDNSKFSDDFSNMWNKIQETIDFHIDDITNEKDGQDNIKNLTGIVNIVLEELDLYKNCKDRKPITETEANFNYRHILEKVNESFDKIGSSQFKVDMQAIPTAQEYQIRMQDILKQSLYGPNKISTRDIEEVKIVMSQERNTSILENINRGE